MIAISSNEDGVDVVRISLMKHFYFLLSIIILKFKSGDVNKEQHGKIPKGSHRLLLLQNVNIENRNLHWRKFYNF